MSWALVNAEERWKNEPDILPSRKSRESILRDFKVKLVFRQPDPIAIERMWVLVTKVDGHSYQGTLVNRPSLISSLKRGDLIDFGPHHIIDIIVL